MAIPKHVLKQQEEMDELVNQRAQEPPEGEEPEGKPEEKPQAEPATQAQDATEKDRPESQEADFKALYDQLQRKHEELQKRYKAEVSPVMQQRDQLLAGNSWAQQRIIELETDLRRIKEASAQAQPKATPPKFGRIDLDRFKQDYDDESLQAIAANANAYADILERQSSEIAELRAQVGQQGQSFQRVREDTFFSVLDREVPNWREIEQQANSDGRLGQFVPFTGMTFDQALKEHLKNNAPMRAVEIYKNLKPQEPAVTDNNQAQPKTEHIVPDGSRAATPQGVQKLKDEKITAYQLKKLADKVAKSPSDPKLAKAFEDLYERFLKQEYPPER